jgi:hypothetical protein
VTFLGHADRNLVKQIERFTGNKVSMMEIPGLESRGNRGQSPKRQNQATSGSDPRGRNR